MLYQAIGVLGAGTPVTVILVSVLNVSVLSGVNTALTSPATNLSLLPLANALTPSRVISPVAGIVNVPVLSNIH